MFLRRNLGYRSLGSDLTVRVNSDAELRSGPFLCPENGESDGFPRRCNRDVSWIAMQQSLLTHRKTIRATAILKCDRHKFIGHMAALWWWALDNADRDGSLHNTTVTEIAEGSGWGTRKAENFTAVLVAVGFLDEIEGGYRLHNWEKHTRRFYDGQEKKEGASDAGKYGNHVRWHVEKGVTSEECEYCIAPNRVAIHPESGNQSLPHSPHSPTNKPDQPDKLSDRERLKAKYTLTPDEWTSLIRTYGSMVNARYWEFLDWIGESEELRSPKKGTFVAFDGFLKKTPGFQSSAGGGGVLREVKAVYG